jgi:uncharacterized SAM-binding protein YcdF (DUF218 family)
VFILLAKTLDLFLSPLSWALLLLAASLLVRRSSTSRLLVGLGVFTLYVFSLQPVALGLAHAMEGDTKPFPAPAEPYDAVIVLGGAVDAEATRAEGRPSFSPEVARVLAGYEVLHKGVARNVLLSGGAVFPAPDLPREAEVLRTQLLELGIAPDRIFIEPYSRNTYENALNALPIVRAQGWKRLLLVTSAAHMARAEGCFRAIGVSVDTLPVHFHIAPKKAGGQLLPRIHNLTLSSDLLHELVGRLVYRALGYSR